MVASRVAGAFCNYNVPTSRLVYLAQTQGNGAGGTLLMQKLDGKTDLFIWHAVRLCDKIGYDRRRRGEVSSGLA
jgi:hypothetical protein